MSVLGFGCMRLSTAHARDDQQAIAVIHAALDAGVTLLDTANVYGRDERDLGHNERLINRALTTWPGDKTGIRVATKGGLIRRGRRWIPDGRAKQLQSACHTSREALGVETIDLYQLHVVDPRTPIETSVRAIATLQNQGVVRDIGLCNVRVGELERAGRIAPIATVQVELHPFNDTNLRNGVVEYCLEHGIDLIAYRPFGGDRHRQVGRDAVLQTIATRHDVTPYQVVLAWLLDLGRSVTPIPGATTLAAAASLRDVTRVALTDQDRRDLDRRMPASRLIRVPRSVRRPPDTATGDVVLIMGHPAAGKSTLGGALQVEGYGRLNRDTLGGRVADLIPALDDGIRSGHRHWVLDNTFPARATRNQFIETAWNHGVPVRCLWLTTSKEDAQINAIHRLVERYGHLPSPDELKLWGKTDPNAFGPSAQFRYERELEPPVIDEGFVRVDDVEFVRESDSETTERALIIEHDGVLCGARSGESILDPERVALLPGRREVLQRYVNDGWKVLVTAWRPQLEKGEMTEDQVESCFTRLLQLLGIEVAFRYCRHPAGPPVCWCRKPLPGLPIEFAMHHRVNLSRSVLVGRSAADNSLARRLGMTFRDGNAFFGTS